MIENKSNNFEDMSNKQIEEMAKDHFAKVGKKEKEKQIKEMAGIIDKCYPNAKITNNFLAKMLYNAGYRKSTNVAEEIFAEIEQVMSSLDRRYMESGNPKQSWGVRGAMTKIAELKKKYTKGKDK